VTPGPDPRHDIDAMPRVGTPQSLWPLVGGVLGALALGAIVFLQLANNRTQLERAKLAAATPAPDAASVAPAPPRPEVVWPEPPTEEPEADYGYIPPQAALQQAPQPTGPSREEVDRLRAPALVVDLSEYKTPDAASAPKPADNKDGTPASAFASQFSGAGAAQMNASERFALKLGVGDPAKPAKAAPMGDLSTTVVEGAIIPAVLETALNSDLPGYVRAVVSRDVRGFDGSLVLIPRGSRLIGQYSSGVALGQSRAFVIWTRLIRPDGVNVELAAPATDGLGRGGLAGKVDRHFLQRFGGAMVLSLLNLGAAAATDASDTSIVIATTRAGSDAAGAALMSGNDISPTVTVPQGAPVRVFVTQDIDFSDVGPALPADQTP